MPISAGFSLSGGENSAAIDLLKKIDLFLFPSTLSLPVLNQSRKIIIRVIIGATGIRKIFNKIKNSITFSEKVFCSVTDRIGIIPVG